MLGAVVASVLLVFSPLCGASRLISVTIDPLYDADTSMHQEYTQDFVPPTLVFHEGEVESALGTANYSDETFENGWAYLEIDMRPAVLSDGYMAYLAGALEGAVSHEIIYNSWRNTMEGYCDWKGADFCLRLRRFISRNSLWMDQMIHDNAAVSPLWYQVSLVLYQLRGMTAGYRKMGQHPISDEDFLWMNLMGDLEDLESVLSKEIGGGGGGEAPQVDGHCSALIKLLPGNTDLYASHVTWNSFQSMLRIQKKYFLPFKPLMLTPLLTGTPGHTVTFTSYPGIIHSADDYYLLASGLLTMETTIGNSNPDLWKYVKPEGELQEWIRVLVANRLAVDAPSWTKIFKLYNSGTYNNQWMVLDYSLFRPGKVIRPNTLWVLEQLPGIVLAKDMSQQLGRKGYWASYNVPAFPAIFNASGLPAMVEQYGDWFSYDKTPRALIFARDQGKVKDLGSMIKLMRYNDFKNDPLSACECDPPYSAENAISARNDLNPANGTYPFEALGHRSHAGTDMKVTNLDMFADLEFLAVAGPTYDQQPVFQWSTSDFADDTPHYGHPDVFQFPVVHRKWSI